MLPTIEITIAPHTRALRVPRGYINMKRESLSTMILDQHSLARLQLSDSFLNPI